jgi:hypothetical protein
MNKYLRVKLPLIAAAIFSMVAPVALGSTTSGASTPATCTFSQLSVTLGSTRANAPGYVPGTRVTDLNFVNHGAECSLPRGKFNVRAFRETHKGKVTDTYESIPTVGANENGVILKSDQKGEAIFEVIKLPAATMKGPRCGENTASGILIEGYGLPASNWIYLVRTFPDVCFYSGTGKVNSNLGLTWIKPPAA